MASSSEDEDSLISEEELGIRNSMKAKHSRNRSWHQNFRRMWRDKEIISQQKLLELHMQDASDLNSRTTMSERNDDDI